MANRQHVGILKQGVNTWNKWRERYPDTTPDLSHKLNINFAQDPDYSLYNAYYEEEDIDELMFDFSFCLKNLENANFKNANLRGVDFANSNLSYANFEDADLSYANLSHTHLSYAKFNMANLNKAKYRLS
jgi:uncharacterized protein YjbI with pentapeptide repeats